MLSRRHFASSELNDRTFDLNSLHNNFENRLRARGKVLNDSVTFYRNADEVHLCNSVYQLSPRITRLCFFNVVGVPNHTCTYTQLDDVYVPFAHAHNYVRNKGSHCMLILLDAVL